MKNTLFRKLSQKLSWWRSVAWFAPLVGLATILYGMVSLVCSLWDPTGRRQHRVAQAWARMLLRLCWTRTRVIGAENLVLDRPCVIVCNHLSYMDVPVLFARLPLQFRILAKKGLFSIPFLGGHLKRSQHLPVEQDNPRALVRSLLKAADSVKEGLPVFVFPEAGRSFDGEMKEFVTGAFFLAVQARVPILPLVLVGTYELLEPGTAHLRPHPVDLVVCPPVSTEGKTRKDIDALAQQVRGQMLQVYRERHGGAMAVKRGA